MHTFSTPLKHQKTLRFSDFFRGYRKGALGTNELMKVYRTNTTNPNTIYDCLPFSYRFLSPEIRCNEVIITIISYFVEDCRTKANISIRKIKSSLKHQTVHEKKETEVNSQDGKRQIFK